MEVTPCDQEGLRPIHKGTMANHTTVATSIQTFTWPNCIEPLKKRSAGSIVATSAIHEMI